MQWKAVEQYFTVVLIVNPLALRVKPWAIHSFLTFDSMYRILKCDHSLHGKLLRSTLLLFFNLSEASS